MFTQHNLSARVPPKSFRRGGSRLAVALVVMSVMLGWSGSLRSQDKPDEKQLKAKVAELVKGLDASKAGDRQAAQDELVKLGPAAIPFLPAADAEDLSAEQKRRLADVRSELGKQSGKASMESSKITLSGKGITLSDAIAAIQKQTGNQIVDLREEFGQQQTNPEFSVDWKDKPFWEAMDELCSKTQLSFYLHTGERVVGLVSGPNPPKPIAYGGPLRFTCDQIVRRIQFENRQKECLLQMEIAWEPKQRPILFEIKPDELIVKDDQDRDIKVEAENARPAAEQDEPSGMKAAVDASMIRTDFIIHLAQPPKGAEKIKSLKGKMTVVLPTNIQSFEFADLAKAKNVKKQSNNVTVTLEKFKVLDDGLWGAEVVLEFEAKSEAFESYETWFYDKEAYLQKADGTRFPTNGGMTLTESGDGRIGIQYRFVDAPGKLSDYKLVYKTPSTIVKDSVSFEFKDIELP